MIYICEFCDGIFTRKSNLNSHQRSAKYCLKIQEAQPLIKCEHCYQEFTSKRNLQQHYARCNEFLDNVKETKLKLQAAEQSLIEKDNQIKELIKHHKELEDRIERLASRAIDKPTKHTNTNINTINLTPLTTDHIQQYLPQLTREHIEQGSAGYAQFAVEYPLKDTLVCVDKARKKWRFKNENGEIVDDHEGQIVTEKFFQSIIDRNDKLIKEYVDELMALSRETGDTNQVIELYRKITELNDTNFRCNDTAIGKETEFKKSFINEVTKLLGRIKIKINS